MWAEINMHENHQKIRISKEFWRNVMLSTEAKIDFSPSQIDEKCVKKCSETFIWSLGTKKFCVEFYFFKLFLGWNLGSKFEHIFRIHKSRQRGHFSSRKMDNTYCKTRMHFSPLIWCNLTYKRCFGHGFSPP